MAKLVSTNPAKNYEVLGSVRVTPLKEMKAKVANARAATAGWKALGVKKRIELLRPLYQQFLKRKNEIALLVTREIGKPITEAKSDLDWDGDYFQNFLDHGAMYLQDEIPYQKNGKAIGSSTNLWGSHPSSSPGTIRLVTLFGALSLISLLVTWWFLNTPRSVH